MQRCSSPLGAPSCPRLSSAPSFACAITCSWWRAFSFLRLQYTASVRGYTFLLVALYLFIVSLLLCAAACAWASRDFMRNDFKSGW
jgi:hypothetical protein